jgi:uncharacterized OB-fold protein
MTYLPEGLPAPNSTDSLMAPCWQATRQHALKIQSCAGCGAWQWGPEWICHCCHSFDLVWKEVAGEGRIYSYQRIWHPVHRALEGHGPYIAVLVELPHADNVRMIGNLLGDPRQDVRIGTTVRAVFESHDEASPPFTLVHWRAVP